MLDKLFLCYTLKYTNISSRCLGGVPLLLLLRLPLLRQVQHARRSVGAAEPEGYSIMVHKGNHISMDGL